jgi:carboxyl-terminal processing protease
MISISRLRRSAVTAFAATTMLSLLACSAAGPTTSSARDPDLALYRNVLDRVRESYVEPVGEDSLVTNSLKGMLTGLDPHSDYMSEQEYREMLADNQGEFAGIGAELTRDDNHPKIISPIDDTPAARAGLKSGDIITRIDGRPTDGLSLREAVDKLRGPSGSTVKITISRAGQRPFEVSLTRAVIHVASVKWHMEPNRIGYVRITTFAERTPQELGEALRQLKQQAGGKLDGFVLDLRNDPGGLLDASVRVAGAFLEGGTVVATRGRDGDDDRMYQAPANGDRLSGVPMVLLINGASASASEIVAGALQDHHRATLVGTRSFGKGSVQTIIPLDDGKGALRLTTARYYTPSGRSIQGQGIAPDVVVVPPKDQQSAQADVLHEADLKGALRNTGSAVGKPSPAAAVAPNAARAEESTVEGTEASIDPAVIGTVKDYQLAEAVKRLRQMMAQQSAPIRR